MSVYEQLDTVRAPHLESESDKERQIAMNEGPTVPQSAYLSLLGS